MNYINVHLIITDSLLCHLVKKALTFSLNSITLTGHPINPDTSYGPLSPEGGGGGTLHMKGVGMLVGNFELNS